MMASIVNSDKPIDIRIFRNVEEIAGAVFEIFVDEFSLAIAEKRTYHLVLSGGSTPVTIFKYLSHLPLKKQKWDFLHLYWGDERCVHPEDPESNFGNIWNAILKHIDIPPGNIHRIKGENNINEEIDRYSEILRSQIPSLNGVPCFDLTLLGIGEDGHTASLFPDALDLLHSEKLCYEAKHPQTLQPRITLSLTVLNNSKKVVFLATGPGKADVISKVINSENGYKNLPSAYINPVYGKLSWLLDMAAASKLRGRV